MVALQSGLELIIEHYRGVFGVDVVFSMGCKVLVGFIGNICYGFNVDKYRCINGLSNVGTMFGAGLVEFICDSVNYFCEVGV